VAQQADFVVVQRLDLVVADMESWSHAPSWRTVTIAGSVTDT
jgi:hypothetical protein